MTGVPDFDGTDAELLAGADGEPSLFGLFYRRHVDAVLGYHYRRTGCAQTAAQPAFI